jgi:NAD(P)-dependent dehydrogenase (short-subunit alcohol dehydrogenase family)
MGELTGKISVVTGGGTGIGFAIAERLAREGSEVVLVGRRLPRLEDAAAKIGAAARAYSADVADEEQVRVLFDSLEKVDVLVTCAGGAVFGTMAETPPERWRDLFHGRFFGQINCCHCALPKMGDGAVILLCSGIADMANVASYSGGSALCGAVNALGKNLAVELAPRGIRVNVLSPGLIAETAIESNLDQAGVVRLFETAIGATPLRRAGTPVNAADAAYALISNDYLTGVVLPVDGGWTAT